MLPTFLEAFGMYFKSHARGGKSKKKKEVKINWIKKLAFCSLLMSDRVSSNSGFAVCYRGEGGRKEERKKERIGWKTCVGSTSQSMSYAPHDSL